MDVGSKPRVQHHEHSRVLFLYHKPKYVGRGGTDTLSKVVKKNTKPLMFSDLSQILELRLITGMHVPK